MSEQKQKNVWVKPLLILSQVIIVVIVSVSVFIIARYPYREVRFPGWLVTPDALFLLSSLVICTLFSCFHIFVAVKRTAPTQASDSAAMSVILWAGQVLVVVFLVLSSYFVWDDSRALRTTLLFGSIAILIIYTFFHVMFILRAKRRIKVAQVISKTFDGVIVCGYCRGRNKLDAPVCVRCAGPLV